MAGSADCPAPVGEPGQGDQCEQARQCGHRNDPLERIACLRRPNGRRNCHRGGRRCDDSGRVCLSEGVASLRLNRARTAASDRRQRDAKAPPAMHARVRPGPLAGHDACLRGRRNRCPRRRRRRRCGWRRRRSGRSGRRARRLRRALSRCLLRGLRRGWWRWLRERAGQNDSALARTRGRSGLARCDHDLGPRRRIVRENCVRADAKNCRRQKGHRNGAELHLRHDR